MSLFSHISVIYLFPPLLFIFYIYKKGGVEKLRLICYFIIFTSLCRTFTQTTPQIRSKEETSSEALMVALWNPAPKPVLISPRKYL